MVNMVVILVATAVLASTFVLATQPSARARAQMAACRSNLRGIHTAIKMYETAENRLPVMRNRPGSDDAVNAAPTFSTSTNSDYDETGWGQLGDQGMQNVWLLIRNNNLGEMGFQCPADAGYEERDSTYRYGWTSSRQFSYSIQWPYARNVAGDRNLAAFQSNMNDNLVIMADRNPGGSIGDDGHLPSNHAQGTALINWAGTADAHDPEDSCAGIGGDDIYTAQIDEESGESGPPGGMPSGSEDTSLTISPR